MRDLTHNITPGHAAGNTGAPRPASLDGGHLGTGGSLADRIARSQMATVTRNAEEVATLATALAATGFGGPGIKADDLASLGLDRLRELTRKPAGAAGLGEYAGYSFNDALSDDGDTLRAASTFRTTVQGASQTALTHLGAAKLAELQALIDDAIAATQASSPGYL